MSKKNLACFLFWSVVFSQIIISSSPAQTYNPRYFNERFVIKSVQMIHSAQMTYNATAGYGLYASLEVLGQMNLIDEILASGNKHGYHFEIHKTNASVSNPSQFYLTATPLRYGKTGIRSFYIDQNGEMRGANRKGEPAAANDPLIDSCSLYGNEKCVIMDLRIIHTLQLTYQTTAGNNNFGSFNELRAAFNVINQSLASGATHGYRFTLITVNQTATTPAFFKVSAVPEQYGVTGTRSFYVDVTGVICGADKNGVPADENDPPVTN
jgi:hypothetical protein